MEPETPPFNCIGKTLNFPLNHEVIPIRTVDDWLEDWLAEHRNVRLEEPHSMANAVRAAALADGYSLERHRKLNGNEDTP